MSMCRDPLSMAVPPVRGRGQLLSFAHAIVANRHYVSTVIDKTSVGDKFMTTAAAVKVVSGMASCVLDTGVRFTRYKETVKQAFATADQDIGGFLWGGPRPDFAWHTLPGILLLAGSCNFMQNYIYWNFMLAATSETNTATRGTRKCATAFMIDWKNVFDARRTEILAGIPVFVHRPVGAVLDGMQMGMNPPDTVTYTLTPPTTAAPTDVGEVRFLHENIHSFFLYVYTHTGCAFP